MMRKKKKRRQKNKRVQIKIKYRKGQIYYEIRLSNRIGHALKVRD